MSTKPKAIRDHWSRVVDLGCVVTGGPCEVAHCHGGSMLTELGILHTKGKKLARMDWLVIGLDPRLHRVEYGGLDANVEAWEATNGTQVGYLDMLCHLLKRNLWNLAGYNREPFSAHVRALPWPPT